MSDNHDLNPLVPLAIVVALPVIACLLIMFVDPGINRSLFTSAVKNGIILVLVGGAASYVASMLAARSKP
jgi:Sec-independent protein secretion pathway component TatC